MKTIEIKDKENVTHIFYMSFFGGNYNEIIVKDVCVIKLYKYHNHRYDISCFFYDTCDIYYRECISTLKKLYDVIQNLLQENLHSAIQK